MSGWSVVFGGVVGLYGKAGVVFVASVGGCFLEISLNLAALRRFDGEKVARWLQAVHGCYGIGGLAGPIVVYFF